jgi:transcriptional regulator with XRE-family HTH domain
MVNSAAFAKRIEKILSYYGISATAFAETISFNRSTISHILSGRNKPSLEFVMKIVNTYPEVELYWLLNGKGDFPPLEDSNENSVSDSLQDISAKTKDKAPSKKTDQLSSKKNNAPISNHRLDSSSNIDRIVIFYADGSFKEYLP